MAVDAKIGEVRQPVREVVPAGRIHALDAGRKRQRQQTDTGRHAELHDGLRAEGCSDHPPDAGNTDPAEQQHHPGQRYGGECANHDGRRTGNAPAGDQCCLGRSGADPRADADADQGNRD
jgi:hypothetical protein